MTTTLLNDRDIICHVNAGQMIEPFVDHQVREVDGQTVVSYGLSSYGYDVRLADEFKRPRKGSILDPHHPKLATWDEWGELETIHPVARGLVETRVFFDEFGKKLPKSISTTNTKPPYCTIDPHTMVLARTLEYVRMPVNSMALCLGKSTYARLGLIVNVTPLEAGWHGYVTLELSNTTPLPIRVYAGEGIAQFLFFTGERPITTYADRDGKYQGQTGVTLAKL